MDLSAQLAEAEGAVLVNFRRCIGVPGCTQRELADLSEKFEDLKKALKAAPTDASRLEIMQTAVRVFDEIAKKGRLHESALSVRYLER